MKPKSVLTLTTLILLGIVGAGAGSAYMGYRLGAEALKGVSQPEDNPTRKLGNRQKAYSKPKEFQPLNERAILVRVYDHIHNHNKKGNKEENSANNKASEPSASQSRQLPLATTDQDVTLQVVNVTPEADNLILSVNLTNDGGEAVQFLYSFLEVKNEQGETIGATVEGLPETLPANGKSIEGIVKIPLSLVSEQSTLSLSLTDYPEQKRKLMIKDIPLTP